MKKLNPTTYQAPHTPDHLETVIGDEKQSQFYPRVKLKAWGNEANLSVGVIDSPNGAKVFTKNKQLHWQKGTTTARFYNRDRSAAPPTYLRLLHSGAISPTQIAAEYELGHNVGWTEPTIRVHWSDRPAMMYYGLYPAGKFIDFAKLDLPECRLAPEPTWNDPMYMDAGLKLIDVQYDELRDDKATIDAAMKRAVTEVVESYGVKVSTGDKVRWGKLYFQDGDKQVKFFSTGFFKGHYYFYINLDTNYNQAYDYYQADKTKPRSDQYAYGLRRVADIPDQAINDIVARYAELIGLPLQESGYSTAELSMMQLLQSAHTDEAWVKHGQRSDPYMMPLRQGDFEFDVVLDQKPASNRYDFSITTKGLKFEFQPDLSPADKLEGKKTRSPHVVGSYAVYHESKQHFQYKTGKAFHIYRPIITDAYGQAVFGDLNIDQARGVLSVIIPPAFLNQAAYPVTIDPTFGYTTLGASAVDIKDTIKQTQTTFTGTNFGDADVDFNFGIDTAGGAGATIQGAIYRSNATTIDTRSEEFAALTISPPGSFQTAATRNSSGSLVPGNTYRLSAWGTWDSTNYQAGLDLYFDTVSGVTSNTKTQTYVTNGWPSTASASTESDTQYSIYVDYVNTKAFVQRVVEINSLSSSSSFSGTVINNTTSGNFVIIGAAVGSGAKVTSVTDSNSNTWSVDVTTASAGTNIAIASARMTTPLSIGDTVTLHLNASSANCRSAGWEFANIRTTSPLDKNVSATGTASPQATGSTGTLTRPTELLFTAVAMNAGTTDITQPTNFNDLTMAGVNSPNFEAAYRTVNATTAQNPSWSWGTTTTSCGVAITTYVMDLPPWVSETVTVSENIVMDVVGYTNTLSVSDSPTVSENLVMDVVGYTNTRSVSDTITTTENVALNIPGYTNTRSVSDTVTLTENLSLNVPGYSLSVNVNDSATVTDTPTLFLPSLNVTKSESVSLTDTPALLIPTLNLSTTDAATVSDSIDVIVLSAGQIVIIVSENPVITENLSLDLSYAITVSDSASVTDSPLLSLPGSVNVTDSLTVSDVVDLSFGNEINVADSTSITEDFSLESALEVNLSDSVLLDELLSAVILNLNVDLADVISADESVSLSLVSAGQIIVFTSENVSVDEALVVNALDATSLQIVAFDTASLVEAVAVTLLAALLAIVVSDSITASEALTLLKLFAIHGFFDLFE